MPFDFPSFIVYIPKVLRWESHMKFYAIEYLSMREAVLIWCMPEEPRFCCDYSLQFLNLMT